MARRQPKARYHFDFTRSDCTRPDMQAAHHLLLMHVRRRYHALVLVAPHLSDHRDHSHASSLNPALRHSKSHESSIIASQSISVKAALSGYKLNVPPRMAPHRVMRGIKR